MTNNLVILVRKILKNEILKFGIVGAFATALHYGIYLLLLKYMLPNVSYSIGYLVSFVLNFFLSAHFTFKSSPTIKKGIGFGISHLINYALHILLLNLFLWLNLSPNLAPIPIFMIVIPVNFILVRFVFKTKKLKL